MTDTLPRTVHCVLLKREAPGLARRTYPGPLGERIFNEVSQEAWTRWVSHQTMLINENAHPGTRGAQVPGRRVEKSVS